MMNLNASRPRGRVLLGALTLLCLSAAALAHPLRVEDMQNLSRVGEVRISPDGLWRCSRLRAAISPRTARHQSLESTNGGR